MPRFALLGILLPGWALAAPLPTIAVVGIHQESLTVEQQRRGSSEIVATIEASGFFSARTLTALEPFWRGREALILEEAFLGPGRALRDDGRVLYNTAQPEDAAIVLEDAVAVLRLAMATAPATWELWDALFLLGASHIDAGQGRQARAAFEAAVAVSPLRAPDTARFPPLLVERYEGIRRERTQLHSTLVIDADERDTAIWLNGEPRGIVPLTLRDVVPGENFVHARSPKGFFAYQAVEVPEAGERRVSLRLREPTLGYPTTSRLARARQVGGLYRALGRHAGVDLVLMAGVVGDELILQLYSPRMDGFSQPQSLPFVGAAIDEAVEALPDLLIGVNRDGTFDPDNRSPVAAPLEVGTNRLLARSLILSSPAGTPERARKPLPKWAAWTLAGVGAAAVIGGTAAGVHYANVPPDQGVILIGRP